MTLSASPSRRAVALAGARDRSDTLCQATRVGTAWPPIAPLSPAKKTRMVSAGRHAQPSAAGGPLPARLRRALVSHHEYGSDDRKEEQLRD